MKLDIYICDERNRIINFLNKNSSNFTPALDRKIDIFDYSNKLSKTAENIFLVKNDSDVGHAAIYINMPPNGYLSSFCIDKDFQEEGLGSELMNEVIKICNKKNISNIKLEVDKSNTRAILFYEKFGFSIFEANQQSILMIKYLNGH